MTSLEVLESFGAVKGKFVLEAHGEELPGSNIIPFDRNLGPENCEKFSNQKRYKLNIK